MGAEYDMLGQLGITIPQARAVPVPPSSRAGTQIVRLREGAPSRTSTASTPTRQTTSYARHREASVSPTRLRDVPRTPGASVYSEAGKTIMSVPRKKSAYFEEYEIYDSEVPSNAACNELALRRRDEAEQGRRAAEQRATTAAISADREQARVDAQKVLDKKRHEQRTLCEANAGRRERDVAEAKRQADADKRQRERLAESYEAAVAEKLMELQIKRSEGAKFKQGLDRAVAERHQRQQDEAQYRMKPDIHGFEIGEHRSTADLAARQRDMQRSWAEQMDHKQQVDAAEHARSVRQLQFGLAMSTAEEQERIHKEKVKRQRNQDFLVMQKRQLSEKKSREENNAKNEMRADRERVRHDVETGHQKAVEKAAIKQFKKEEWQRSLQHQMAEHLSVQKKREEAECKPHMAHNGLGMQKQRGILLRCPVTNQLLPPSAFNLQHKPAKRVFVA